MVTLILVSNDSWTPDQEKSKHQITNSKQIPVMQIQLFWSLKFGIYFWFDAWILEFSTSVEGELQLDSCRIDLWKYYPENLEEVGHIRNNGFDFFADAFKLLGF